MKTTSILLSAVIALVVSGCVSTANISIPKARLAQAAGSTIVVSSREKPDFADMKPSNAMFGALGGAVGGAIGGMAAVSSGNALIMKYNVQDPAATIAKELCAYLTARFKVVQYAGKAVAVKTTDINEIANAAGHGADLVLDVQTVNWSCIYLPLKWTRYRVIYTVKIRLIDVKKREMIAEGFFAWKTPDGAYNPTFDELFANGAEILRQQLDEASKAATEHFKTEVLNEKG
ncbi:MAG: hypothetical protein ACHQ4G_06975 [Opitutales bacterium]